MKHFIKDQLLYFTGVQSILDILIFEEQKKRKENHTNPFVQYGQKCFSQTDEDGITNEIVKRLEIKNGYFIEFGVGNGMENNTLFLLSLGWNGRWFGGKKLAFSTKNSQKLTFDKRWITKDNIVDLCQKAQNTEIDLISLDLDGNDYHLIKKILENNITPSIFIIEYNAKFIPPVEFIMNYNVNHSWSKDDYFGGSLMSFNKLFEQFNYSLVCCNSATGSDAFFVKKEFMKLFPEVPKSINDIYSPPNYFTPSKYGHKNSIKTVECIINNKP